MDVVCLVSSEPAGFEDDFNKLTVDPNHYANNNKMSGRSVCRGT